MDKTTRGSNDKHRAQARWRRFLLIPGLLILGASFTAVMHSRSRARLAAGAKSLLVENVSVIRPAPHAPITNVSLPATMKAYSESLVFARTSGYLHAWYFDIGAHVKKGQLLATIDSPEVDQELLQARAALQQTKASLALAQVTNDRYQVLIKEDAVSKQAADQYAANLAVQQADLLAAEANVNRLEQLQGFEKVYAPYAGVITARKTEVGDLINAGNAGSAQELFRIAQISTIRVFVTVPEAYSRQVIPGSSATVCVTELPDVRYTGTVVRTDNAIDPGSRTLLTELDVKNSSGTLLPGLYAEVQFQLPVAAGSIVLPTSSVLFQAAGAQVGVVNGRSQVEIRKVALGRDFGNTVEILSGVGPNDMVIADPPDYLVDGMPVSVRASTTAPTSLSDMRR
jgi:RND family efflux transporter MFP subunit